MIHYAEAYEEEGVIIALDQEKAYDKIAHDYLWKALKAFDFPEEFINTIRTLYQISKTCYEIYKENSISPNSIYDGDTTTSKSNPTTDGKPHLILPLDSTNLP
jgi:hypothetical protein